MNCNEARPLLQACADGEIGAADGVRLKRHLEDCNSCVSALRELRTLRKAVRQGAGYHRASPALRARVLAALPATEPVVADVEPVADAGWRRWFTWSPALNATMAAVTVAAVGLGLTTYAMRESPADLTAQAVVASHVRALLSTREIDVASSDRHTVKPWFNGRIDYAPEVRDLAGQGFPLVGGRLDYVDGRRVAVLVYRRAQHPLEVFVLPDKGDGGPRSLQGYEMESWTARGMRYWAVTDASAEDLRAFVAAWKRADS
ncbi:anti-sigma factor family protein [Cupriavidus pampae]|uniref:Putative zinc-finger domain-containing protein n=1 Tax=Cupriavidus pampae TaxID=659251 RepID=A0ABN7ZL49_9BURK|nr:anti-sigma factor [Cupriavidus pampae]CAG9184897.1 hypothetical protein LMG32289_05778 [Cupriavidus pampae]